MMRIFRNEATAKAERNKLISRYPNTRLAVLSRDFGDGLRYIIVKSLGKGKFIALP